MDPPWRGFVAGRCAVPRPNGTPCRCRCRCRRERRRRCLAGCSPGRAATVTHHRPRAGTRRRDAPGRPDHRGHGGGLPLHSPRVGKSDDLVQKVGTGGFSVSLFGFIVPSVIDRHRESGWLKQPDPDRRAVDDQRRPRALSSVRGRAAFAACLAHPHHHRRTRLHDAWSPAPWQARPRLDGAVAEAHHRLPAVAVGS